MTRHLSRTLLIILPVVFLSGTARAQFPPPPPSGPDSVSIAAGSRYEAGGFHRFLFGDNHREAWLATIRVPVLNLETFQGGLVPTEVGGGMQTVSLHLESADGREFVFRSIDKNLTQVVPPSLQGSLIHDLIQDQTSSMHPFGALVAASLLEAAKIPHVKPYLAVMPDDPRLGEFREQFAGVLGLLEERPNEGPDDTRGFAQSTKITGTETLFEGLNADPDNRVDALAYLEARLFDMWINDWDRHTDQWRWIYRARGEDSLWTPVPRDRDQAFVRFEGLLIQIGRLLYPKLIPFDSTYPSLRGLTANSADLDFRLLAGLERSAYDSLAQVLQARFSEEVIGRAMTLLPGIVQAIDSAAIANRLISRLGKLDELALDFYQRQSDILDVHATDVAETATLEYHPGGGVTLSIVPRGSDGNPPWFRRTFRPDETAEVRVYLHKGDDRVVLGGDPATSEITFRIIGGNGNNVFPTSAPGDLHFYDRGPTSGIEYGPDDVLDRREWIELKGDTLEPPTSDRGGYIAPRANIGYADDLGLVVAAGVARVSYGFRKYPYAGKTALNLRYGTGYGVSEVEILQDWRREESEWHALLRGGWSQFGVLRFHGLGNETPENSGERFDIVRGEFHLRPALAWSRPSGATVSLGPVLRHGNVDDRSGSFVRALSPYGSGTFTQSGLSLEFTRDSRDSPNYATRGMVATATAEFYPGMMDLEEGYGAAEAGFRFFKQLPVPTNPVLAIRAGGRKVWGRFPFYDAAFLGGQESLRGFAHQRFAGEASAFGGLELRVPVGTLPLYAFPARLLVFGFGDAGRVFVDGEDSDLWHNAFGGGVSLSFVTPGNGVNVAVARSDERTSLYVSLGFEY